MIVSGPVTLLVALWGMTSARTREVRFVFGTAKVAGLVVCFSTDDEAFQALMPTFLAEKFSSELLTR